MDSRYHNVQLTDHVAIIGAGFSGIGMAIQLKRLLCHTNFHVYEKLDSIGGTWAQNRYPNLSCDVPSEFYSFSFFQKSDWSEKFASQQKILEYIHDATRHFQLDSHISLRQECLSAVWSHEDMLWTVSLHDHASGYAYNIKARYVVTAMGVLNTPKGLDDLPLLANFGGQVFHTSDWREIDFDRKRIMVIGNGCSANQVIPWILNERRPKSLVQIVRSEQWVAPKPNHCISALTKFLLTYIPLAMRIHRLWTAWQLDRSFLAFRNTPAGAQARKSAEDDIRSYMTRVANPKYHDILVPRYELGAKRAVMDHGYLQATNHEKFALVKCDGLRSVTGDDHRTLVDQHGNSHDIDIVILANGFKTQDLLMPMKVAGIGGRDLRKLWQKRGGSEAYMGVSVSGFPNFFMLAGPNTLPSGNSTLHGIECSIVYITRLLRGLWAKDKNSKNFNLGIMPKPEAEAEFNKQIQEQLAGLVYSSQVSTWYINKDTGKNTLIWPGTQMSFWWSRCISPVQWADWAIAAADQTPDMQ